jgi:peptidoglycan/LPS O-acetylase OafA/YrhL
VPGTILEQFIAVTRFHCMMAGALAAIAYYRNHGPFLRVATNRFVQLACWGALLLVLVNRFHVASFLDNEILAVVTSLIIVGQVTRTGLLSLENKILDFLGKISYGIYVFHPILIFLLSRALAGRLPGGPWGHATLYVLVLGATIGLSHLSYVYFESRFLRLKRARYSVVKSSGTMEGVDGEARRIA